MDTIKWFKTEAKALLRSHRSGDANARERVATVLVGEAEVSLQRAQHVVAVESGFASWKALLDAPETERQLAIVMAQEPLLNDFGIGPYGGHRQKSQDEQKRTLTADREKLRASIADVTWTAGWLIDNIDAIKTINLRRTSYGLKHIAEKRSPNGYLTNGVFIAAAMVAGYPYKIIPGSPNPQFGMSERSIKRLLA